MWLRQHSAKLNGAEVTIADTLQKEYQSRMNPQYPGLSAGEKVELAGAKQQVKDLKADAQAKKGIVAGDISRMKEIYIVPLFFVLPKFGLQRWAPDVFEDPTSRYNQIHETIAIATFQNLARGYAYAAMRPLAEFFEDSHFLRGIYSSFVFQHMKLKQRKELNNPGGLVRKTVTDASRKRRAEVRGTHSYDCHANRTLVASSNPS